MDEPALLDAYTRYVAQLKAILTLQELATYAGMYQRDHGDPIAQSGATQVLPAEEAIRAKFTANTEMAARYQQFIGLLATKHWLARTFEV
jgi:hypothetical protein